MVLRGCFWEGMCLYKSHMPITIGGRAGFDDTSRVLPQAVLAALPLVRVGVEMEGLELEPAVRWDFLSAW